MTEPATAESLRSIGWLGDPANALREVPEGSALARVVAQHRSGYRVHDGSVELAVQTPATLLRKGADPLTRPGVGDWVQFRRLPEPTIEHLLPRRTALVRGAAGESRVNQLIAANVDVVFIVCGLDGDFNLRRIERYLVLTRSSGARPVVVLTKEDISVSSAAQLAEVRALAGPDTLVISVNARTLEAGRTLLGFLPAGTTAVLVGSSGAGKSTLTNSLLGIDRQATAEVRVHDSRGRHTTTHRALLPLPSGACLIDTPGMRELKLTGDEDVAAETFDDIDALLGTCRFSDCSHGNEPGCAIRAAIDSGSVPRERWEHYLKLSDEAAAASASVAQRLAGKRQEKAVNRAPGKRLVEKIRTSLSMAETIGHESFLPHLAELDRRLIAAVKDVRLLAAVSWPADVQEAFLARYHRGDAALPEVVYPAFDYGEVKVELAAILRATAVFDGHPVADYIHRTAASFHTTTLLLESLGTDRVTGYSIELFGRPGHALAGTSQSNLDAARHFIVLADEVMPSLAENEASYVLSAETVKQELESRVVKFFTRHKVRIEIDPTLTAKAAAGPTRIRLRASTGFTEYDWHQLLEHEAFVHSLTALNGRDQPNLGSLGLSSARITATQEGLATFAELITGSIDIARMKRISLRIEAIHIALGGADFIQVFEFFRSHGQSDADSFTSAMRVFRGVPLTGGQAFTKDTVYLHGLLSVHTFFRWALKQRKFKLCRNLCAGKMTLGDAVKLEPWFDSGYIAAPEYLPPWMQRANGLAGVLAFSLFANRIRLDKVVEEDLVLGV